MTHQVQCAGNMLSVFFADSPGHRLRLGAGQRRPGGSRRSSTRCWTRACTRRRSAYEAWFVSAALDDEAFERIAAALPAAARAAAAANPGAE